jgi:RNA polymerase sigma factor (TIGR02999 family)
MPYPIRKADYPGGSESGTTEEEKRRALDQVFSLVYEDLRRLASVARRREPNITLNSTAVVHEVWMKLKDSPHLAATSLPHFKAIAARAMRQVLVDEARRRNSQKRGGEVILVTLDESPDPAASTDAELLALESALEELAEMNARQARMVELRFFGGLSVAETAEVLGVSESVIERDWRAARAWLANTLKSTMKS